MSVSPVSAGYSRHFFLTQPAPPSPWSSAPALITGQAAPVPYTYLCSLPVIISGILLLFPLARCQTLRIWNAGPEANALGFLKFACNQCEPQGHCCGQVTDCPSWLGAALSGCVAGTERAWKWSCWQWGWALTLLENAWWCGASDAGRTNFSWVIPHFQPAHF